jgi:hypothetical protein
VNVRVSHYGLALDAENDTSHKDLIVLHLREENDKYTGDM